MIKVLKGLFSLLLVDALMFSLFGLKEFNSVKALDSSASEDSVLEDSVLEDSALENYTLDNSALEDSVLEDSVLEDSALENYTLDNSALESSALESSALEDSRGTVKLGEGGLLIYRFKVKFEDDSGKVIGNHKKVLSAGLTKEYDIPANAETVTITLQERFFGWRTTETYKYKVNGDADASDYIKIVGAGTAFLPCSRDYNSKNWSLVYYK